MIEKSLKAVDMHEAFKRDPSQRDAERIVYVNLGDATQEAKLKENSLLKKVWDSPVGSVEEEKWARRAAVGYLVMTGEQLQKAKLSEQPIVSDRFTEASAELYGLPDDKGVRQLAATQLKDFKALVGNSAVDQIRLTEAIEFLSRQIGNDESVDANEDAQENALAQIKDLLHRRYGKVLAIFDAPEITSREKIPAHEVAELFQKGIDLLAESDPVWVGWKSEIKEGESAADANSYRKVVTVGSNSREPKTLAKTFAHEVLAHALQAVNGSKTGDEMLEHGLPGSHRAHEGFAVFLGSALRGNVSDRTKDFYMDIAFALGQLGQKPISRPDLQKFYLDKMIIRAQSANSVVNEEELTKKAWGYVNRIYRGSLGNNIIGINTIEIDYYHGFAQISDYIQKELAAGKSADDVFDYLASGRFDPLNDRHVEYRKAILDRHNHQKIV